jgi:sulfatase modifying factor 1
MRAPAFAACALLVVGCGSPPETTDATVAASALETEREDTKESSAPIADAGHAPCPEDMAYADTDFCPDIERRCLDMEHERINHLDICHSFAREGHCRYAERRIAFCIDRYEYPNRKGAHPVWMLDWYEAQATCESKGKRLCWASEWTAACEGPEHTPFPYGYERDHRACNIDSFFIDPMRPGPHAQFFFYSKDKNVALRELSRLDQSVPSGSMESCKSGFGVYDMTGNVDEWVINDEPTRDKAQWAGLKGGAWGHVRSQCRPMTTSHEPEFRYYFVGFRCCRDADGPPPWTPSPEAIRPPAVEPHDFAPDPVVPRDAPGPSKTKFTYRAKRP